MSTYGQQVTRQRKLMDMTINDDHQVMFQASVRETYLNMDQDFAQSKKSEQYQNAMQFKSRMEQQWHEIAQQEYSEHINMGKTAAFEDETDKLLYELRTSEIEMKMSDRGGNSFEFNDIVIALQGVCEQIETSQLGQQADQQYYVFSQRQNLVNMLGNACDAYLKVKGGFRWTSKGRHRRDLVKKIKDQTTRLKTVVDEQVKTMSLLAGAQTHRPVEGCDGGSVKNLDPELALLGTSEFNASISENIRRFNENRDHPLLKNARESHIFETFEKRPSNAQMWELSRLLGNAAPVRGINWFTDPLTYCVMQRSDLTGIGVGPEPKLKDSDVALGIYRASVLFTEDWSPDALKRKKDILMEYADGLMRQSKAILDMNISVEDIEQYPGMIYLIERQCEALGSFFGYTDDFAKIFGGDTISKLSFGEKNMAILEVVWNKMRMLRDVVKGDCSGEDDPGLERYRSKISDLEAAIRGDLYPRSLID